MDIQTLEIVQTANNLVRDLGTRDPHKIARELGIEIIPMNYKRQRGAYKVLLRNRFIFIKNDLHPVMENIVLLHEIGHDVLHRKEAVKAGGFKEFNIFNMQESRMEYEANVFVSQVSLVDEEILEYPLWLRHTTNRPCNALRYESCGVENGCTNRTGLLPAPSGLRKQISEIGKRRTLQC